MNLPFGVIFRWFANEPCRKVSTPTFKDFPVGPISEASDDSLRRLHLAKGISEVIAKWTQQKAITVAIVGPRGSGKSSLKNLCLRQLTLAAPKAVVVDFQPWEVSSTSAVVNEFFLEIEKTIGKAFPRKVNLNLVRLKGSVESLEQAEWNKELAGSAFTLASAVIATFLTAIKMQLVEFANFPIDTLLLVLFLVMWISFAANCYLVIRRNEVRRLQGLTLKEIQGRLSSNLRRLNERVVVVFDDLDTLNEKELRELLNLLARNSELPNMAYILVFDDSNATAQSTQNRKLLEEHITIPVRVTSIDSERLSLLFEAELKELLSLLSVQMSFDWLKFRYHFSASPPPLINNLRDSRRVLNAFGLDILMLSASGTVANINLLDYLLLVVLRISQPAIFDRLQFYEAVLTDCGQLNSVTPEVRASVRDDLLGLARDNDVKEVGQLLGLMFPWLTRPVSGIEEKFECLDDYEKRKHLCHPNFFLRYFLLRPEVDVLSDSELEEQLSSASTEEALVSIVLAWSNSRTGPSILKKLTLNFKLVPERLYSVLPIVLINCLPQFWLQLPAIDQFKPSKRGFDRLMAWLELRNVTEDLVARCLVGLALPSERAAVLKQAFLKSQRLFFPVLLCSDWLDLGGWRIRESSGALELVDKPTLRMLTGICRTRLRDAAKTGEIDKETDPLLLIDCWQKFDRSKKTVSWLKAKLQSQEELIFVLRQLCEASDIDFLLDEEEREVQSKRATRVVQHFARLVGANYFLLMLDKLNPKDMEPRDIKFAQTVITILRAEKECV